MWICTPFGILMPALRPPRTIKKGDKRTLQVRTRERAYLDTFRERYCPTLGKTMHFPNHDYPWKAYVTPKDLAVATAHMALAIDYEKFKPESTGGSKHGLADTKLANNLHDCYSAMWGTQLRYGDGTSSWDTYSWNGKPDPKRCKTMGHWFGTTGDKPCVDCGKKPDKNAKTYQAYKPAWTSNGWDDSGTHHTGTGIASNVNVAQTPFLTDAEVSGACSDCGGGYYQEVGNGETWIAHENDCLQSNLCPECGNDPHELGCPLGKPADPDAPVEAQWWESEINPDYDYTSN
jgi:hypothetical protein